MKKETKEKKPAKVTKKDEVERPNPQDMDDYRNHVTPVDVEAIAKTCHQANKSYCESRGDVSQVDWERAPEWQKDSAIKGVLFHLSGNHGPEASHNSWLKQKREDGWKFGAVKNPEKKEHPSFRPFHELAPEEQFKDILFSGIVTLHKQLLKKKGPKA
ncbi:MAG: RyR domain-containing protein [Afipia sp.]